jgi:hypothetical protein
MVFFSNFCSTGKTYRVIGVHGHRAAERDREEGRGLPVFATMRPSVCRGIEQLCVRNHAPISYALFGKQSLYNK